MPPKNAILCLVMLLNGVLALLIAERFRDLRADWELHRVALRSYRALQGPE